MYTSTDNPAFQLEIFNGKTYEPHMRASEKRAADNLAEFGRTIGKPWRVVLPEKAWPAKPSYRKPAKWNHRGDAYLGYKPFYPGGLSYEKWAIATYLDWARAKGLETVTAYRGHESERRARMNCWQGDSVRLVDVADFLGDAPVAELEA